MTRTVLSFLCYGIAFAAFLGWFWLGNRLGRDPTAGGQLADAGRRQQLRWLMATGFAALVAAYLL